MSIGSPPPVTAQSSVNDPIQSNNIIVLSGGSLYLRFGLASDSTPHSIYHVIARKNTSNRITPHEDPFLIPAVKIDKELNRLLNETQKNVINTLNSCLTSDGKTRIATSKDKLIELNRNVKPQVLPKNASNGRQWTQNVPSRDVIIGDDVMLLKPTEPYHIRWPIRRGQLNVHPGIGGSLTSVISDLETIWSLAFKTYLGISPENLCNYRAVLLIPDVYIRTHIKYLIDLILNRLNFESCIVMHESVCATFGAGLSYACVVDCGDQKTSICCVEDGFSSRVTRITLDYGGSDITQLFYYFLKQRAFPYIECKSESRIGGMFLQELKELYCHTNLDIYGPQEKQFLVQIPEQSTVKYVFHVGDECLLAPLALFYPEMFSIAGTKKIRVLCRNDSDPEDPFDENYLIQTKRKYGETNEITGQSGDAANTDQIGIEFDELDTEVSASNEKEISSDQQILGIDHAILQCIDRCDSDEIKRRMYSCILIIGGGISFDGIENWLNSRLSMQIPLQYRGQSIEIITKPKDTDPKIVSWRGATVMCLLDTAHEMWINKGDWEKRGIRVLRERASFVF